MLRANGERKRPFGMSRASGGRKRPFDLLRANVRVTYAAFFISPKGTLLVCSALAGRPSCQGRLTG